jgi:hypothetical protein
MNKNLSRHVFTAAFLLLTVSMASSQVPFSVGMFRPGAGYAIPNGLWLTGDFNGDGKTDIFHAVQNADYANVWLSNGDGTFSVHSFSPWPGYAIPNGVWLAGDFNGDGKTDIVHAVANTDYANVWLSNGDGTFTVRSFSPWSGYEIPNGVWLAGDFNGDGKTDILHAVANTDYANVWLSNGDGTFAVRSFSPWAGYSIPNGLWIVGDFNGDGKSDVLHAVQDADYANVWLSNGDGTFNVRSFSPWAGYAIPNGVWLTGDFNGDGKTDIFHAVQDTDYANVWLSNGDGTFNVRSFSPWAGYAIPNGVWLTGDFDGDGKTDVFHAVQDSDYANVWLSNGDGTFNVSSFSPWSGYAIPNGLWLAGDITGDRKTDIVHAVASGDYVHPWIAVLPTNNEVSLAGLEITQAIQDMAEDVTLVAGKTTWARAYLEKPGVSGANVNGVLRVRDIATGAVTTVNSNNAVTVNPAQNGQLRTKRETIALSLNFPLPATVTTAGQYDFTLSAVSVAASGTPIPCSNCAAGGRTVAFVSSSPLRVRMVGLSYTTGAPATAQQPSAVDFSLLQSWLGRAYPVAQVISSQTTVASSNAWPFSCNQANAQLSALRATEVSGGTDARTHYYGLVSNGGGFMRGCSAVPASPDPTSVGSGPTGSPSGPGPVPVNVSGDTDASFGDWYGGHEIAHTFGRNHPGFCNGNSASDPSFPNPNGQLSDNNGTDTGLDTGDSTNGITPIVLPGAARFDIMTYCNQPQWLSAYAYEGIRARLNAENPSGSGAPGAGTLVARFRNRLSFITPQGIQFRNGIPTVEPQLTHPVAPVRGKEPSHVVRAFDAPLIAPKPFREKPYRPDAIGREHPLPAPKPAMLAPARVLRSIVLDQSRPVLAEPEQMHMRMEEGRLVSVVATLNLTRHSGKILYTNHVQRGFVSETVPDTRAYLRIADRNDKELGRFPAIIKEDSDIPTREDRTALISSIIPDLSGAGVIELLLDGKVVDRVKISAHGPTVQKTKRPYETERKGLVLEWQASHPDQIPLTYLVQISPDGVKDWKTLAIGQREPRIEIAEDRLKANPHGVVRIIANDGYNESQPLVFTLAGGLDASDKPTKK